MKIAATTRTTDQRQKGIESRQKKAAIPLLREATPERSDNPTVTVNVGGGSKETYHKLSTGRPEEIIHVRRTIEEVIKAQELTAGPRQYNMARRFLCNDALSLFNTTADTVGTETTQNFKTVMDRFVEHYFPAKALAEQKRYMRRYLQKPRHMLAKDFFSRVNEINTKLDRFPPYEANQRLADDEVQELLEAAIPAEWQRQNLFLGFDPLEKTQKEFIDQCVKFENLEGKEGSLKKAEAKSKNSRKRNNNDSNASAEKDKTPKKRKGKSKWCVYHRTDSHDTGECKVILDQAKKMRGMWDVNQNNPNFRSDFSHVHKRRKMANGNEMMAMFADAFTLALERHDSKKANATADHYTSEIATFANLSVSDEEESTENRRMQAHA